MAKEDSYERDLVLAPNTFAYILDKSQGEVVAHVGPTKVSLADTDQPVKFNPETKRFDEVNLAASIQPLSIAPEGWYLILKNPSFGADGKLRLPNRGKNLSQDAQLTVGRKVNIPGPVSIALWPGQMAQVVQGHHLRSNQYLRARVYDEAAALKNRDQAIIKVTTDGGTTPNPDGSKTTSADTTQGKNLIPEHFAIGQQFNIKGTDVSFFVPPTGIEIVRDDANDKQFIRDAETLEVLEYCILLDEDGNKEFKRGPAVIFPEPTQTFVSKTKDGTEVRKFLAFELNENMGLYIKVIADYTDKNADDTETSFKTGDELFITGKTHPVYFPREEHAIVRYGDNKKINYSVAIPAGEGRYVLNRKTGEVRTVFGPTMLLPDPRGEIVVRRVLKEREVTLMYPGNTSAVEANRQLNALRGSEDYVTTSNLLSSGDAFAADTQSARSVLKHASGPNTRSATRKAMKDFAGDEMQRSDTYTPPRTITLDNKYDGVVTVNVWTGFAVNVVKKTGERRVVVGPETVMLAYDESLEPLSLSRGCPKDKKNRKEDVYLRVLNNRVTDRVKLQTKDLVDISVVLSYRVNFTGDSSRWFNVDDYVGLLTDHMRSLLRNEVQRKTVEEFWGNKIDIVRDCVLGKSEGGSRGRSFEQNGMTIYDLDFVDAEIHNTQIAALLVNAQHESIRLNLELEKQRRDFSVFEEVERLKCERTKVTDTTSAALVEFQAAEVKRRADLELAQVQLRQRDEETKLTNQLRNQSTLEDIQGSELARKERSETLTQKLAAVTQQMRITELNAIKDAEVAKVQAITPDLIAAMQSLSHTELVTKISENLSPLAILGGESLVDVARKLLTGTALEYVIDKLPTLPVVKSNGTQRPLP